MLHRRDRIGNHLIFGKRRRAQYRGGGLALKGFGLQQRDGTGGQQDLPLAGAAGKADIYDLRKSKMGRRETSRRRVLPAN
jgi:hypothetical protein